MEQRIGKGNALPLSWVALELAVILSVFSQIEAIERIARPGMYAMWVLVLVLGVYKNQGKLPVTAFSQRFILAYILFCLFCVVTGFIDHRHFSANYIRVLLVPLLVTIAGDMYANEDEELVNQIGRLYLFCAIVFAFWVQRTYFPSYASWLSTKIYLFQEKNSAGQIWMAAIFVSICLLNYRSKFEQILIYLACVYLFIMTGICQCRTALLGVAVAIAAFTISRAKNKVKWMLFIVLIAVAAWFIPVTHRFIEQALFLNKYAGTDLNTFSSGRISGYETAFGRILSSPIVGVGRYYVDCSYILIMAESGIIGLAIIEWIWVKKILMCFRYRTGDRTQMFLFMMTVFYIVESLLEGFPPFGPGVSSFMFWFMSSILINKAGNSNEAVRKMST